MKKEKTRSRLAGRMLTMVLSLMLVFSFAGSIVNIDAFAEDGGTVTRAEWLTALVDTFDMTVEDGEIIPDNYFSDLDSSSEYYRDFLIAVEFGLVDVEAGYPVYPDAPVTREFAASTLNFCLGFQLEEGTSYTFSDAEAVTDPVSAQVAVNRGWLELIDGKFSPETNITVAEKTSMLADASEVWHSTDVDESHKDTYKVKDGVIDIPEETEVALLDDGSVQITDCPYEIKAQDKFIIHLNGLPVPYTAVSVESDGTGIIIQTEELALVDAFDEIDMEGSLDGDAFVTVEPAEDVEVTVKEYEEEVPASKKLMNKLTGKKPVKVKDLTFKGKIDLGAGMSTSFTAALKNNRINYRISLSDTFVQLDSNMSMSCTAALSMDMLEGRNKTLANVGVPGVGGLDLVADVSLAGKVTVSTKGSLSAGIGVNSSGLRVIKKFKTSGFQCVTEVTAYAGLEARLGLTGGALPVKGYVYAKAGVNAKYLRADYPSGTPMTCVTYAGWVSAEYGAKASWDLVVSKGNKEWVEVIYDLDNSPVRIYAHYEDFIKVPACTREADFRYYTKANSPFWTNGWSRGVGSSGFEEDGYEVPVFTFTTFENEKAEKEAKITGYTGNGYCLNIPATVSDDEGEYPVTVIGSNAFQNRSDIHYISIPDSVTSVESKAFYNCPNIEELSFPDSVTAIGDLAFAKATGLAFLTLPAKVEWIGGGAFAVCNSLTSVEIPKSLNSTNTVYDPSIKYDYHYGIFMNSTNLREVTFEEGTTSIITGVLANTLGLEEITIPDTITSIGNSSFKDCTNLQSVKFSSNLATIGESAFYNCTSLTQVNLPDTVTEIGVGAFAFNTSLTDLHLSKALTYVGGAAFGRCDALTTVEIPKSITSTSTAYINAIMYDYHYGVFMKCPNLANVTFEEGITTIPQGILANTLGLKTVKIPDTVTKISNNAFEACTYLESVEFGKNVLVIGSHAFSECSSLDNVVIPDSVTEIDSFAFAKDASLKELTLSKNLRTIQGGAFGKCDSLETVTFPKTLKQISSAYDPGIYRDYTNGIFANGQGPKKVIFEEGTETILNGILCHSLGLTQVEIPEGVTTVQQYAFEDCPSLESVTFPDSVTTMEKCVCIGDSSLASAKLSKNITNIPESTFSGCASLTEISLPDKITSIGTNAFLNSGLTSIDIPAAVTSIGQKAFSGNGSLKTVKFNSENLTIGVSAFENCTSMEDTALPKGFTSIGNYAFRNCDTLTEVTIPDTVTSLGKYAYADCAALKSVSIGKGVTALQEGVLSGDEALTDVTLPLTLTSIGSKAFANDTNLKEIFIPRTVAAIDSTAFSYYSQLTIYGVKGTYAETFATEQGATFVEREIHAEDVSIEKELTLPKGKTYTLTLNVVPANTTDEISWASTNESVAKVSATGAVTAVGEGTATIKVYVGDDLTASCKVTVTIPVTRITVASAVSIEALGTYTLKPSITPSNATDKTVTFTSSDPSVADVSETGVVTGHKKGTATITVTANDGSGVSATSTITVTNNIVVTTDVALLESEHRYANNCTDAWLYTDEGAYSLKVTFDERTEFEEDFDYLYIYNGAGTEVGRYSGTELAGQTIEITGDSFKLQLNTSEKGTAWGFKVTSVERVEAPCEHEWSEWTVTKEASCTVDGLKSRTCSKCGEVETEVIKAEGHKPEVIEGYEATCTESGLTDGEKCSVCGEILTEQTVIPALGHDYKATVTEPTCTEGGFTTYTCSRCGDSYVADETAALGHDWSEWKEVTPATEESAGLESRTCKRCGEAEERTIPPLDHQHTLQHVDAAEATCTEAGNIEHWICTKCKLYFSDDHGENQIDDVTTPALGHDYKATVTEPTCTEAGYTTYTCSRCGDSYTGGETAALGHKLNKVDRVEPTYESEGCMEHWKCERCGKLFSDAAGKTEVSEADVVIPPLDKEEQEKADAAIHDSEEAITTAETEDGKAAEQASAAEATASTDKPDDTVIDSASEAADDAVKAAKEAYDAAQKALDAAKAAYGEGSTQALAAEAMVASARALLASTTQSKAIAAKATATSSAKKAASAKAAATTAAATPGQAAVNAANAAKKAADEAVTKAKASKAAADAALEAAEDFLENATDEQRAAATKAVVNASKAAAEAETAVSNAEKEASAAAAAVKDAQNKKAAAEAKAREAVRQGKLNTTLPKLTISKPAAAKKAITVKWKKLTSAKKKKAQKIEIWVCPNKAFGPKDTVIKTVSKGKSSYKVKGLKAKTRYYIKVRTIKTINGVKNISKWSKTKNIKTK